MPLLVRGGTVKLMGSDFNVIVLESKKLFCGKDVCASMTNVVNRYVYGPTSKRDCGDCNKRFIGKIS